MEPAEAISNLEVVLRDLITQVLAGEFGPEWINECGTPDRVEKWRERRGEETKKRDGTIVDQRLLSYADFTDLAPIIKSHWNFFKPCLGDKKVFETYMSRLEDFRNAPMHSRKLVDFEQRLIQGMTGEIRNKVTLFQTEANAADAHFPRIEFVRDSFGRVARDGILDPDITVHPGDEVTFECAGWDPEDLPLTWILVVNGLHLPFKQDTPTCLVTWRVGIEHIGEGTFVEIQLFGSRPWHRNGAGHDGNVHFRYAVLPRRPTAS